MKSDQLCNTILKNPEGLNRTMDAILDRMSFLHPRKTLRTVCVGRYSRAGTHRARKEILVDARHLWTTDRTFRAGLKCAFGVTHENIERFLFGNQGHDDLNRWTALSVMLGRKGIDLAPHDLLSPFGHGYATISVAQDFNAGEHSDHKCPRKATRAPLLCEDGIPFMEVQVVDALAIQQVVFLFSLCNDKRIGIEFARAIVRKDYELLHRTTQKALERWPHHYANESVRRGFQKLDRDADYRRRFITVTLEAFHWPAMVAYRAIAPILRNVATVSIPPNLFNRDI